VNPFRLSGFICRLCTSPEFRKKPAGCYAVDRDEAVAFIGRVRIHNLERLAVCIHAGFADDRRFLPFWEKYKAYTVFFITCETEISFCSFYAALFF